MNEKQKQLYSYIKDQGATDLSIDDFYAAYGNNPDKAKNVFEFVNSNEMTDLNESDFFNAYFGEVKKKVTSEPVGDTKDTTASTTEQAPASPTSSDSQQSDPISERGIGFESQYSAPEAEGVAIPLSPEEPSSRLATMDSVFEYDLTENEKIKAEEEAKAKAGEYDFKPTYFDPSTLPKDPLVKDAYP